MQNGTKLRDLPITEQSDKCVLLKDRDIARNLDTIIANDLPKNIPLTIQIDFCQKPFPEMPDHVVSNPIQIQP
jgi:hypothetical protein